MAYANAPKTLAEIEALPVEVLTCEQVSKVLMANPSTIHKQATDKPALLGFPVIVVGNRVKIPKLPFLRYMREGKT